MKAEALNITNVFYKNNFVVPYYQRYYDWDKQNCKELLKNILDGMSQKNKNQKHFIGNIVVKKINDNECEIIDGQQRLTTIILIAKSLLLNSEIQNKNHEKLLNIFIENNKIKLTLENQKEDNIVLEKILLDEPIETKIHRSSKIYINFECINSWIKKEIQKNDENKLNNFITIFLNLNLVFIELEKNDDNAQSIFESLNSKGKELDLKDLIKNYIFMNINDYEILKKLYVNFWRDIENNLGTKLDQFIRFFTILNDKNLEYVGTKSKEIYKNFKTTYNDLNTEDDVTNLLKNLYHWHLLYVTITSGEENYKLNSLFLSDSFSNNNIDRKKYLPILETSKLLLTIEDSDLMPFIYLYLANLYINNKITIEDYEIGLKYFESYYIRWTICSSSGNLLTPLSYFVKEIEKKFDGENETFFNFLENMFKHYNSQQFKFFDSNTVMQELEKNNKNIKTGKILPFLKIIERMLKKENIVFLGKKYTKQHILPKKYEAAQASGWEIEDNVQVYSSQSSSFGNFILIDERINKALDTKKFVEKLDILKNPESILKDNNFYITAMMKEFLNFCNSEDINDWNAKTIEKWNNNHLTPKLVKYLDMKNFEYK